MQRVLVIGSGGAGKSTVAARLGALTGLPVHHLDTLYWQPGWVLTPAPEWARRVAELTAGPAWIMDGNYGGTLEQRLAACDTVLFLDLPRLVCVARVLRRWLRYRGRSRPDMTAGCPERITGEFLRWVWRYPVERRPGVLRRLAAAQAGGVRVVHLRSTREVERFLSGLARDGA